MGRRKAGKHRFRKHTGVTLELKAMWAEKRRRLLPIGSSDNTGPLQRPRVCLLCSSFCFLVKPKVNSQLMDKLFYIPVEEFQTKYSSLEKPYMSYINFCRNCISFVQDSDGIYTEWKRINEKIREIENQLETKMQQSQPLLKDIFKENTILCQLYEDIRSNFCPVNSPNRSQQPLSTKNTASFLNLGMVVPTFDFEDVENISITPEETTELEIETEIKVEAINEDEDWDGGVIESVTGNDDSISCSEDLQLNSESPNLLTCLISHILPDVDAKVDNHDYVPDDVELSSPEYDGSSSNTLSKKVAPSKTLRKRKPSPNKKAGKLTQKRSRGSSCTSKKFSTKRLFKCLLCEEEFVDKKTVTVHIESLHSKKSKFIRKTVKEDKTYRTNVSEYGATSTSFSCPEADCSRIYETEVRLRQHLISVHNYPAYNCDFCSYQTKIRQQFNLHRLLHTGEKPHVCYFCGAAFRKKERVTNHIRQHTLERPYCCNICHKDFTSASKLSRHKQIHTEERLFLCSICGKKSKTANNLYIHMWSHDPSQKHRYSNSKSKRMKKSTSGGAADKTNDDIPPPESTTFVVQQKEIAKSNTVSTFATTLSHSAIFNMDSQNVIVVDAGTENFQFNHNEPVTSEAYSLHSSNPLHSLFSTSLENNDFSFPILQ